ncbi:MULTISPECIES: DUF998 domain-containing protein [Bacteria]|uniref:DUF998 domain-containing protein n=1 Tax=Bacteria TaxID=2 RepID=UPI003C7B6958
MSTILLPERPPAAGRRETVAVGGSRVAAFLSFLGSLSAAIAIVLIWAARSTVDRAVYVSEMGAPGQPTEAAFRVALTMVALAGVLIGVFGPRARSDRRLPGLSGVLGGGGVCFAVAAFVPCTSGCPAPGSPAFTLQDLVHISAAIVGFVLACVAMVLVTAFDVSRFGLFSLAAGGTIAVVAGSGGLLSLTRTATTFGALCEFAATTLGLLWLLTLGLRLGASVLLSGADGSSRRRQTGRR